MLDAADALSSAAIEALSVLNDATTRFSPDDYILEQGGYGDLPLHDALVLRQLLVLARAPLDQAHRAQSRIGLLFGHASAAGSHSRHLVTQLRHVLEVMSEERPGEFSYARNEFLKAAGAHEEFGRAARGAIEKPRLARTRRRWRTRHDAAQFR